MRKPSSSAAARSASVIEFDALDRHRRGVDLRAEGERGEDGELVGGVEAADVEGRIGLGVAEPLRVGEADVERQGLRLHPRQNVVAGAVENARDAADRVARQALAQRLDHRNAAPDRRLVKQRRVMRLRQFGELEPVLGEHRLVGGDDRQPAPKRGLDRLEGHSVRPADQFDEHVDVGFAGELRRVALEARPAELGLPVAAAARAIALKRERPPRPLGDRVALPPQKPRQAAPDYAETGDAQPQRLCHGSGSGFRT